MKNIVIIGGVSCDPSDNEHDANPYNFINPGVGLAKRLGNAIIAIHAKSYEIRAKKYPPEKEHWWVARTVKERKEKKPDHFLKTVTSRFTNVKKIDKAKDLSNLLRNQQVQSITYFGHSNKSDLFLEYNTDGRQVGIVTWGAKEAASVPTTIFSLASLRQKTPLFASFGCHQAENGGLCEALQKLWGIKAFGARGKTNFKPIGQGKKYPSGSYFTYPMPRAEGAGWDYGRPTPSTPDTLY